MRALDTEHEKRQISDRTLTGRACRRDSSTPCGAPYVMVGAGQYSQDDMALACLWHEPAFSLCQAGCEPMQFK